MLHTLGLQVHLTQDSTHPSIVELEALGICFSQYHVTELYYIGSDSNIREIADNKEVLLRDSPTELGIAYDAWGPNPNIEEAQTVADRVKEFSVSIMTTHSLAGA